MTDSAAFKGTIQSFCIVFAYTMSEPLLNEIKVTFGSTAMYHPISIWLYIMCLVWVNTQSLTAAIYAIIFYEVIKNLWISIKPAKPRIVKVRKLFARINDGDPLSNSDILFLNEITPNDVTVLKSN